MTKEYELKVYWENTGIIKIKANSLEEAIQYAENANLPLETDYVPDSFNVDIEFAEEVNEENLPNEVKNKLAFGEYY